MQEVALLRLTREMSRLSWLYDRTKANACSVAGGEVQQALGKSRHRVEHEGTLQPATTLEGGIRITVEHDHPQLIGTRVPGAHGNVKEQLLGCILRATFSFGPCLAFRG